MFRHARCRLRSRPSRFTTRCATSAPALSGSACDAFHPASAHNARLKLLDRRIAISIGIFVFAFDEQPVLAFAIARPSAEAHKAPAPLEPLAMQDEGQVAAREIARGVAERLPGALIPKHDRAAAILALGMVPSKEP